MTVLDWVAAAVILGGLLFLRRRIAALVGGAAAWVRKRLGVVLGGAVLVALLVVAAWKIPEWRLAGVRGAMPTKDFIELENSIRATIAQIAGGVVLLVGVYFTWRRVAAAERQVVAAQQQVELAREGQITERFTRAIEQLGSEKLEVRLGGIYALERIARDSERDHWPIMEVLTAYVRENAPRREQESEDEEEHEPRPIATDIQAILTVIGRRRVEFDPPEHGLDLRRTSLSKAVLRRADFSRADLSGANLSRAFLPRADLSGANLSRADLSWARLSGADLWRANLLGANLLGANLSGARLSGANLWRANLRGVHLLGVDLSEAKRLAREQIESAITDETTILPDYLREGRADEEE